MGMAGVSGLFQLLGFGLFAWRSGALAEIKSSWGSAEIKQLTSLTGSSVWPKVSIVVPARNEEGNLPKLFESFLGLDYPSVEFVIVDDHSSDRTLMIANQFVSQVQKQSERLGLAYSGVRAWEAKVIQNPELPAGWGGKSWACHNGFQNTTGEFILFTDADTFHHPNSLRVSVGKLMANGGGLCSAIPFHLCVDLWEKIQSMFQALLLVATGAFSKDLAVGESNNRGMRLFAIGQYLLFSRKAYEKIGGHESVKLALVEDVPLAFRIAELRLGVEVVRFDRIVDVRMYPEGFGDFLDGWRRNFNWAFKNTSIQGSLEMFIVVGWILDSALLNNGLFGISFSYFFVFFLLWISQRNRGQYPWWSHLFYVLFALVFCWVSALSFLDLRRGAPVKWRGRTYG